MKIKIAFIALITLLSTNFFSPIAVQAQQAQTQSYEDYLFNYSRYQTELNKLETAKASYKKDSSLQNLTNLLESTRTVYLTIGDTMIAYNYFLQSEVVGSNAVPAETLSYFNTTLQETNQWYIDQKSVINSDQNDLIKMQATIDTYNKNHASILIKINQLRLITNSARIANFQDQARTLLAKLFTYINNTVSTPDPRQEIWKNQIIERVDNTNALIKKNFELIPLVGNPSGGTQANTKITNNSKTAIENIRKTASYLNEINNSL